jgi:hypothetical protein
LSRIQLRRASRVWSVQLARTPPFIINTSLSSFATAGGKPRVSSNRVATTTTTTTAVLYWNGWFRAGANKKRDQIGCVVVVAVAAELWPHLATCCCCYWFNDQPLKQEALNVSRSRLSCSILLWLWRKV